jgi:polar amino acid transport system substrate-binding protein
MLGVVLGGALVYPPMHSCPGRANVTPLPIARRVPNIAIRHFSRPAFIIGADDEQATPTGIDVEIVQAMARSMNLEVEYIRCPWVRCLELMETGKADILSSVYKKPERTRFMAYLDTPYLTELPIAFYYLKGPGYTVNRYEDIYQFNSIGVLRGASYFERFDQDPLAQKYNADTQDQLFPMLLKGRIEAMAGYIPT